MKTEIILTKDVHGTLLFGLPNFNINKWVGTHADDNNTYLKMFKVYFA